MPQRLQQEQRQGQIGTPERTDEQHGGVLLQHARNTLDRLGLGPAAQHQQQQQQQQQPTPNEDWTTTMAAPTDLFTYFDDPFWSSINFGDMDFSMQNIPSMDMAG